MQYEIARAELQGRLPRITLLSVLAESVAMVAVAGTLFWLV